MLTRQEVTEQREKETELSEKFRLDANNWADALRTTDKIQGQLFLMEERGDTMTYCCLGVLACEVEEDEEIFHMSNLKFTQQPKSFALSRTIECLPQFQKRAMLIAQTYDSCLTYTNFAELNDSYFLSFKGISKLIETAIDHSTEEEILVAIKEVKNSVKDKK